MASASAALPLAREHNPSGSQMAARHTSSGRQARWQPYSFMGATSIPNKKALPCLVRPHLSLLSESSSGLATLPEAASTSHITPIARPPPSGLTTAKAAAARQRAPSSQLPTPLTSPPSVAPTLLQQTSSNYVLELSLAILASVYFQPAYQASPNPVCPPPGQGQGEARSPTLQTPPTLSPASIAHPLPPFRPSTAPSHHAPQKEQVAPLTPQSPRSGRISPVLPLAPLAPTTSTSASACLPPPPPPMETDCVLPSRSDLARHLNLLGAIGSPNSLSPQPTTGSMRWFLTELFKRAAVPGLIIRVAAGYVLRCRTAIACALRSVAVKSLSSPNCPPERTPRERVLTDARRVFLAALVLACKFVFDKPYDNRSWSLISGLGSRDIGECERVVGEVLEWRLWIGAGRSPSCSR
ncbi:hypothetical protein FRC07_007978 [Ceratobasidium sp. 392]|nr:hypothetical protein FRC07_007978 [Ceratobasidium sp. 392]